jgi:hypothetical protein
MPNPKDFNWNYRPESYWDDKTIGFVNIKGEMRRRIIDNAFDKGKFDILPASIFLDELSNAERHLTTSIHPSFMGGEYLPDYLLEEVEIARVSLESVTWDVYSIRAKKVDDNKIQYRVVDEYDYWENGMLRSHTDVSVEPFTFGEIVSFIDNVEWTECGGADRGLTTGFRDLNYNIVGPGRDELEELLSFVRVSSFFYPKLEKWYQVEALEWFIDRLGELDIDE